MLRLISGAGPWALSACKAKGEEDHTVMGANWRLVKTQALPFVGKECGKAAIHACSVARLLDGGKPGTLQQMSCFRQGDSEPP